MGSIIRALGLTPVEPGGALWARKQFPSTMPIETAASLYELTSKRELPEEARQSWATLGRYMKEKPVSLWALQTKEGKIPLSAGRRLRNLDLPEYRQVFPNPIAQAVNDALDRLATTATRYYGEGGRPKTGGVPSAEETTQLYGF